MFIYLTKNLQKQRTYKNKKNTKNKQNTTHMKHRHKTHTMVFKIFYLILPHPNPLMPNFLPNPSLFGIFGNKFKETFSPEAHFYINNPNYYNVKLLMS